ncbi:MAG: hypothetical protein JO034_12850 [Singulisphaera sp.]|nr:hypothetical protein [Singulisphaera sp.]
MPRYTNAYRSRYINAADLADGDARLVIKDAQEQVLKNLQTGKEEKKVVLSFHDSDQLFPLNKTNYKMIVDLFGPDLDEWADRAIVLTSVPCQGPTGMTDGVRVRPAHRRPPQGKPLMNPLPLAGPARFPAAPPDESEPGEEEGEDPGF